MSNKELFSESWYRVSDLKPCLRSHTEIHCHTYRDLDWYVLQDHSTGSFHRFSPEAYLVIGLLDGKRTLDEVWKIVCSKLGDDMPTQDEVINLLSQLHQANVLQSDLPPDMKDLYERSVKDRKNRWVDKIRSPLAIRIPIVDPNSFLDRTMSSISKIFSYLGLFIWIAVIGYALLLVGVNWGELTDNVSDRVLTAENLILLWFIYPFVKLFHEFGHAYAVKHWGGEVHEVGIMFLVLMPVPYVDASAASAFRDKKSRMLVGAAGMFVEAFIAALAVFVWVMAEPGAVRVVAYNVMIISGISTILFNGNPLLKFDAYYILCDYLEIPNLAPRGTKYLTYLLKRYPLGIKEAVSPVKAQGEAFWFGCHATLAFVYRLTIMVTIILFVASKFFVIGVLIAIWTVVTMFISPIVKAVNYYYSDKTIRKYKDRVIMVFGATIFVVLLFTVIVPAPLLTIAEGVVWAPEESRIYAGADSFIREVIVHSGDNVSKGDLLIRSESIELDSNVKILEGKVKELKVKHQISFLKDKVEADIVNEEILKTEAELKRAKDRQSDLLIKSPTDGIFLLVREEDKPGTYITQGSPLAYVADFDKVIVRIVVTQENIELVRNSVRAIEARLVEKLDKSYGAFVEREVPAASQELPSFALSVEGGGELALDPDGENTPKAFEKIFHFDVVLKDAPFKRVGERVYVRFEHKPEPLVYRWYRTVRRVFLKMFSF